MYQTRFGILQQRSFGIASTLIVASLAVVHASLAPSTVLPAVHVISWTAPVVALSLAAAVFGRPLGAGRGAC